MAGFGMTQMFAISHIAAAMRLGQRWPLNKWGRFPPHPLYRSPCCCFLFPHALCRSHHRHPPTHRRSPCRRSSTLRANCAAAAAPTPTTRIVLRPCHPPTAWIALPPPFPPPATRIALPLLPHPHRLRHRYSSPPATQITLPLFPPPHRSPCCHNFPQPRRLRCCHHTHSVHRAAPHPPQTAWIVLALPHPPHGMPLPPPPAARTALAPPLHTPCGSRCRRPPATWITLLPFPNCRANCMAAAIPPNHHTDCTATPAT